MTARHPLVLAALLSAALLVLSYPPLHLLLPPFVALIPFAVAVADLPSGDGGPRAAFFAGALLGGAAWSFLLYWIAAALWPITHLAVPAWLAVVALLAVLTGGVGWTLHRLCHRLAVPLWLALPLAWTAGEWMRGHLPGPMALPWLGLGTSLTGTPELVGIAELVGARGVTFWLALVGGLLAEGVLRARSGVGRRSYGGWSRFSEGRHGALYGGAAVPVAAALAVVGLGAGWGLWRADTLPVRDSLRVAIVQPAIPQDVKRDPERRSQATFAALERLIPQVHDGGPARADGGAGAVELVALPEALLAVRLDAPEGAAAVDRLAGYARVVGAPLLVGGIGGGSSGTVRNSVFLVDESGLSSVRYDKRRLVPMVERVPLVPWLRGLEEGGAARGLWTASYEPGTDWPVFTVQGSGGGGLGARIGAFVCYESVFSDVSRTLRRGGADVLLNVTNDAWFGGTGRHGPTPALWQHPAHLIMRAIETRTGGVRVANTGISLFVDPSGRTREETPLGEPAVAIGTVRTTDVVTLYVRFGDVVGTGAFVVVAGLLILSAAGSRRGPAPRGEEGVGLDPPSRSAETMS